MNQKRIARLIEQLKGGSNTTPIQQGEPIYPRKTESSVRSESCQSTTSWYRKPQE